MEINPFDFVKLNLNRFYGSITEIKIKELVKIKWYKKITNFCFSQCSVHTTYKNSRKTVHAHYSRNVTAWTSSEKIKLTLKIEQLQV